MQPFLISSFQARFQLRSVSSAAQQQVSVEPVSLQLGADASGSFYLRGCAAFAVVLPDGRPCIARRELFRGSLVLGEPGSEERVRGRLSVLRLLCALAVHTHAMGREAKERLGLGGLQSRSVSEEAGEPVGYPRRTPEDTIALIGAMRNLRLAETHTPAKSGASGRVAGRYILLEELAETNTSIVYLAKDMLDGEKKVVKQHDDPDRFHRELRALALVGRQSAHMLSLLDVLPEELKLVLPRLDPLEWDTIAGHEDLVRDVMRTLLGALADLHAAGLCHGDVKPSAVMCSPKDGEDKDVPAYLVVDLDLSGPSTEKFSGGDYCGTEGWIPYDTTDYATYSAAQLDLVCGSAGVLRVSNPF